MRHFLKLGPIEWEGEAPATYYFAFGEEGDEPVEATSDVEGLRALLAKNAAPAVCEPALAAAAAELGLPVEEPPEDALFGRALFAVLTANEDLEDEATSAAADLLDVFIDFIDARPWEVIPDREVLRLQLTRPQRTWELRLIGRDGSVPAVHVSSVRGFLDELIAAEVSGDVEREDELWFTGTQWCLAADAGEPWSEAAMKALDCSAVPRLTRFVDGDVVPWSRADVMMMTAALHAVTRIAAGEEGRGFASDATGDVTAVVARGAGAAAPVAEKDPWSSVGRNDPCPCGSGLKFKKCHEGQPRPT